LPKGFHATNSNEIAAEAGIPVGSFYAYFDDKKHLFIEVLAGYLDRLNRAADRVAGKIYSNREEFLRELIECMLEAHRISPEFYRESTIMRLSDPDVRKKMADQQEAVLEMMERGFKSQSESVENPKAAAFMVLGTLERVVHGIVFSETDIPEKSLIEEGIAMIVKYLT